MSSNKSRYNQMPRYTYLRANRMACMHTQMVHYGATLMEAYAVTLSKSDTPPRGQQHIKHRTIGFNGDSLTRFRG